MKKRYLKPTEDPLWLKLILGAVTIGFIAVLLLLPLVLVFKEALANGLNGFWTSMTEPDALASVRLSLIAAAIAVPLNTVFGIAAAWAIAMPVSTAGPSMGITTRAMVWMRVAPSVAAASSTSRPNSAITGCTVRTVNGKAINTIATNTPQGV